MKRPSLQDNSCERKHSGVLADGTERSTLKRCAKANRILASQKGPVHDPSMCEYGSMASLQRQ